MGETECEYFTRYMQSILKGDTGPIHRLLVETKMNETECEYFASAYDVYLDAQSSAKMISSPMPIIGLYIAVASLVCVLLMLFDIFSGFRHNKRWFPSKLFSLNSLTLTLLSIATKLPTDLTTSTSTYSYDPKITGLALVWASINFFMPSLGDMTASQSLSNMIALTILVTTIFVDICIQKYTTDASSFLFVIMFLLSTFSLLLDLWISSSEIRNAGNITNDHSRDHLKNCKGSMIERLRVCYVRSYISNPQLLVCMNQYGFFEPIVSVTLLLTLLPEIVALWDWGYGGPQTDYEWSIPIINGFQVIVVMVSCVATGWRSIMFVNKNDIRMSVNLLISKLVSLEVLHMARNRSPSQSLHSAATKVLITLLSIRLKMKFLFWSARAALCNYISCSICGTSTTQESTQDPIMALHSKVEKWLVSKGEEAIKRWEDTRRKSGHNLAKFLSIASPSGEPLSHYIQRMGRENCWQGISDDYSVSCLSAVILVRLSSDLLQSALGQSQMPALDHLIKSFDEAFPIIMFIDKNTNALSFEKRRELKFAERMWKYWDFRSSLSMDAIGEVTYCVSSLLSTPFVAAQRESYFNFLSKEVDLMRSIIELQRHSSGTDLYEYVKRLLVDMLHEFLSKFLIVVFKYVTDASPDGPEDRIKIAIELLLKLEVVEDLIQWEFPLETDITSLVTPLPSSHDNHGSSNVPATPPAIVQGGTSVEVNNLVVFIPSIHEDVQGYTNVQSHNVLATPTVAEGVGLCNRL